MKRKIALLLTLAAILTICLSGCSEAETSAAKPAPAITAEESAFLKKLNDFDASANKSLNDLYFICSTMQQYLSSNGLTGDGRFEELASYVMSINSSVDFDKIAENFGVLAERYKAVAEDEWGKSNKEKIIESATNTITAIYGLATCAAEPTGSADEYKTQYNSYEDTAYNALNEIEDYLKDGG